MNKSRHRSTAALAIVLAFLMLTGCRHDEDAPPKTGGSGPRTGPTVTPSCTQDLAVEPAWRSVYSACGSTFNTYLEVENISVGVLVVRPADRSVRLRLDRPTAKPGDLAGIAAASVVPSAPGADGGIRVPPGWKAVATSANLSDAADVLIQVDYLNTGTALIARAMASYVQSKLGDAGERFANDIAQCASTSATLWRQWGTATRPPTLQEVLSGAIDSGFGCKSLVDQVKALRNEPRAPTPADATKDVTLTVRQIGSGVWDDVLKQAAMAAVKAFS